VVPGEFLTLLGPSGSGKTTLLRIIAGFQAPSFGEILLNGADVTHLPPARRGIGMVFQQYALFPHMTVGDNIAYGLKLRRWSKAARRQRVEEMLALVRLDDFADRLPRQLSGGQQQRVALARALAYDPALLLMDEPLGALDRTLRLEMEEEIRRIHRDLGTTFVYVTHDQQEALALSDRIAVMRDGDIVAVDTPESLFLRPDSGFVAKFFADANVFPATIVAQNGSHATVDCLGCRLHVALTGAVTDDMVVVGRRGTMTTRGGEGGLAFSGTITESLLLGEVREVTLTVEGVGRVVALLPVADLTTTDIGAQVTLFLPADDAVLVPAN
jgi:ABC-type Fe3+/spermidine/putrescine transport system ATPase subunit